MSVSPDETALAAANLAFYRALEARSLSAMELVWEHSGEATCVHPGWHRLDGWEEIRRSWQNIFASSRPWTVACVDVRLEVVGDIGWVRCVEVMRPFGATEEDEPARMQATNVFVREDSEWRMVHHHASASPDAAGDDEEEQVN